jgi:hypothetical protein
MSWSRTYSKKVAAIGLMLIAVGGGTVAASTAAHGATHHPAGHAKQHRQHRTLPRGYHYRSIKNPDCGKDQRAIIVWADKGDQSVMICHNGSAVEPS